MHDVQVQPNWQSGIFASWELALVLGLPVLLLLLSFFICVLKRLAAAASPGAKSGDGESSSSPLRDGLRIETSSIDVAGLLSDRIRRARGGAGDPSGRVVDDRGHDRYRIHPGSNISEQDIRDVYGDYLSSIPGTDERDRADRIVLIYRLASIFVSSGVSSIESKDLLERVCEALSLPRISYLVLGLSEITAQFRLGPVVNISCSAGDFYQLSLMSNAQKVANFILQRSANDRRGDPGKANGGVTSLAHPDGAYDTAGVQGGETSTANGMIPARVYLEVLDELERSDVARPYGWIWRVVATYGVCVFAPMSVYGGEYFNLAAGAVLSCFVVAEVFLFKRYFPNTFGAWEVPLVSFTTGLLSPILWQALAGTFNVEQCSANATIGVLLIWFPGSTLVWGAHEVYNGSYVNGAARLIKGIVSALVIALFYVIGWQYWGQQWWPNWYDSDYSEASDLLRGDQQLFDQEGPVASLPPSRDCPYADSLPWYYGSVVFAAPFNICSLVIFNIRPTDLLGVFVVAQLVYLIQGALTLCTNETCNLPAYVDTAIVAFSGGCLAEINQMISGFSKYGSILSIIFVLAPGAGAVRAVIGAFRRAEGDFQGNKNTIWESVMFEGVTYALGIHLAFLAFKPFRR